MEQPWFIAAQQKQSGAAFCQHVETLYDIISSYGKYLADSAARVADNRNTTAQQRMEVISQNIIMKGYIAGRSPYKPEYQSLVSVLRDAEPYKEVDLFPFLPAGTGPTPRKQRGRFLQTLQLPWPIAYCRLPSPRPGQPPLLFVWRTDVVGHRLPEDRGGKVATLEDIMAANMIVRDRLRDNMPMYASRLMLSRFKSRVGLLGKWSPGVLNFLYQEATGMLITPNHGQAER